MRLISSVSCGRCMFAAAAVGNIHLGFIQNRSNAECQSHCRSAGDIVATNKTDPNRLDPSSAGEGSTVFVQSIIRFAVNEKSTVQCGVSCVSVSYVTVYICQSLQPTVCALLVYSMSMLSRLISHLLLSVLVMVTQSYEPGVLFA